MTTSLRLFYDVIECFKRSRAVCRAAEPSVARLTSYDLSVEFAALLAQEGIESQVVMLEAPTGERHSVIRAQGIYVDFAAAAFLEGIALPQLFSDPTTYGGGKLVVTSSELFDTLAHRSSLLI